MATRLDILVVDRRPGWRGWIFLNFLKLFIYWYNPDNQVNTSNLFLRDHFGASGENHECFLTDLEFITFDIVILDLLI